jgi:hypothetical protein
VLVVATVHGVLMAAATLAVRGLLYGIHVDLWSRNFLYAAPVQTHAQSTVVLFTAVAPVFMHCLVWPEEASSAFARMQRCYFVVLVLITAMFLDSLFFFIISSALWG